MRREREIRIQLRIAEPACLSPSMDVPLGALGPKRAGGAGPTPPGRPCGALLEPVGLPPWRRSARPPGPERGATAWGPSEQRFDLPVLLCPELDRFAKRLRHGVEKHLLRSNFILALAEARVRARLPK